MFGQHKLKGLYNRRASKECRRRSFNHFVSFRLEMWVTVSVLIRFVTDIRFQAETLGNETEIVDMMGRSDKFPSMSLRLWVRPGDNIQISGENTLIRTWDVKSTVPEQVANQAFINDSRELWNEYQRNSLLQRCISPEVCRKCGG